MSKEQLAYISALNRSAAGEIHIKRTGREGVNLPAHSHNKHQIVYMRSGTLHVLTGNVSYFVPEKHLAWIPAGMAHELSSNNRQIELVIFYCDAVPNVGADPLCRFSIYNPDSFISENLKFLDTLGDVVTLRQPDVYNYVFSFFRLLPAVARGCALPLQSMVLPANKRLLPVMKYVTEHICDNLTIGMVAAQFGLSARTLSRMFNNEHLRFNSYLNYQRITRAIELLAARDMTLQQIAYEVGFNTPGNFTRVFKHLTGVSPRAFCRPSRQP